MRTSSIIGNDDQSFSLVAICSNVAMLDIVVASHIVMLFYVLNLLWWSLSDKKTFLLLAIKLFYVVCTPISFTINMKSFLTSKFHYIHWSNLLLVLTPVKRNDTPVSIWRRLGNHIDQLMLTSLTWYGIVKIDAVDTHRPKPKTTGSSLGHLSPGGLNTNVRNTKAGASGEIVISPMSPILPISPKLFPNIHSMTSDSQDRKPVSKQSTGSSRDDEHSVPGDMSALDLGAAATT